VRTRGKRQELVDWPLV